MCVWESMDILAGKVIHHGNDSIAWNNKVDISIKKVEYTFKKIKITWIIWLKIF